MKKAYYAPDTGFYYEGINKGAENHIEVEFRPSNEHVLDTDTFNWIIDLNLLKIKLRNKITNERDKRIVTGFDYNGNQIACDDVSQANANAFLTAKTAGMLSFPVKWRTVDNSILDITEMEFTTFVGLMLGTVQTIFQESWVMKDQIELATTIEEVETIYAKYIEA